MTKPSKRKRNYYFYLFPFFFYKNVAGIVFFYF